ncbi:MAG: hypothetical protein HQL88_00380 [Magnetococcales bacterium]|nr:hypothetical protein [Magnetococcales bacterium]
MNLSGQQQPSVIQQEGAGFLSIPPGERLQGADTLFGGEGGDKALSLSAIFPGNTLALQLEARLNGLLQNLSTLTAKNSELRQMISQRDAYIEEMEEENAMLSRQVECFASAQGQVIAGLSHILGRFPGGVWMSHAEEGFECSTSDLLEETVGTA